MNLKLLLLFFLGGLFYTVGHSQEKSNVKFGKISVQDFAMKVYDIDSNANAVAIADIGSSEITDNSGGSFSLEFRRYRRVHILNKNGYKEANVEIGLYRNDNEGETLDDVRAVTYNLENGNVVETKLDKKGIFEDRINRGWALEKFTLPDVKEGSIIEYEYTVKSHFLFNLRPWAFQGNIPVLWSEYNVSIPEFLGYVFLTQGYHKFDISGKKDRATAFSRSNTNSANNSIVVTITDYRWVMKNVLPLKEESFVSTLDNHIAKIEFQLSDFRYPLVPRDIMGTWEKLSADLLASDNFGNTLAKNNGWLGDVVSPLTAGTRDTLNQAKKIYAYVRDNMSCISHIGLYLSQTLKSVLRTKNGTVADINLLLVAMLKYANIQASPVILSTRSNGYTLSLYPVINRFNYVICVATIQGQDYFLDASESRLGFGRLTPDCYNGHARIIDEEATALEFSSDSLMEKKMTSIFLRSDDNGEITGSFQQVPGYYESYQIREKIMKQGKDDFFKEVRNVYGQDADVRNSMIDSLNNFDQCIKITYDFSFKQGKPDMIYINPMFGQGYNENPLKSAERFYPVEMPYARDETYVFTMFIPDGYEIDELPKPTIVKLNEQDDDEFEYIISATDGTISIRSRVRLKRTFYEPAEYNMLREFFNLIVKKQNEQIVLKKQK